MRRQSSRPPWDRPGRDEPIVGDADPSNIYLAVGLALDTWESLEEELALIFASLIGSDDPIASMRAYGSVITSRGRNEMISAAAEAYFSDAPNATLQTTFKAARHT